MESIADNDLPKCRACLSISMEYVDLETPLFLYENDGSELTFTYLDCFNQCTQLTASMEDEYTKYLCSSCGLELKGAYEFIVKARHSHDLLQSQYEANIKLASPDCKTVKIIENGEINQEVDVGSLNNEEIKEEINEENPSLELEYEVTRSPFSNTTEEDAFETEFVINEISNQISSEANDAISETSVSFIIENEDNKHEEEDNEDSKHEEEDNDHEEAESNFLDYRCEICSQKFRLQHLLQQHYSKDHSEYSLHYKCDTCDNQFFSKSSLILHVKRIHLKVEYVDCEICGRTVLKSWLSKHIQKQHEKKREFLCSSCPRIFKNYTSLKKHMLTHQTNRERKFQCTDCDKKFFTIENYRVHQAIHIRPSDRKVFECSLCDKKFLRNTNLKLHMQMHRGETMDCAYCSKKFVRKKDLEIHIRFHTGDYPFKCSLCDKRYAIKGHLKYHEKRHSGVKYKCVVCLKEFINISGLRQHSYEHTGMPLFCLVCNKGFPTRFKVKRHIRSVHNRTDDEQIDKFIVGRKDNALKTQLQENDVNKEKDEEVYEEMFLMEEEEEEENL